ncbi:MAG: hypothetical protein ACFE0R_01675 [Salinarimonas sp.]
MTYQLRMPPMPRFREEDGDRAAAGRSLNLFRRRGTDLVCAVPLDRCVPPFLDHAWEYLCEADEHARVPGIGHGGGAARAHRDGYALFRIGADTHNDLPEDYGDGPLLRG